MGEPTLLSHPNSMVEVAETKGSQSLKQLEILWLFICWDAPLEYVQTGQSFYEGHT